MRASESEILPYDEITVSYRSDLFDGDNVNCLCPNHASIKPKRGPSRYRPLELLALPESRLLSRIFVFLFAHGREGSDSASSNEENDCDFSSSCLANAGLDFIEKPFENFL